MSLSMKVISEMNVRASIITDSINFGMRNSGKFEAWRYTRREATKHEGYITVWYTEKTLRSFIYEVKPTPTETHIRAHHLNPQGGKLPYHHVYAAEDSEKENSVCIKSMVRLFTLDLLGIVSEYERAKCKVCKRPLRSGSVHDHCGRATCVPL